MPKVYLGDGAYAELSEDKTTIILTTEDGISATNTIYLEWDAMDRLMEFAGEHR